MHGYLTEPNVNFFLPFITELINIRASKPLDHNIFVTELMNIRNPKEKFFVRHCQQSHVFAMMIKGAQILWGAGAKGVADDDLSDIKHT